MNKNEIEQIKRYYSITNEEFEEMYLQARKITFANYIPTYGRPIAIFTGGQPGAGKSGIVLKTKREFLEMNKDLIVLICIENYTKSHLKSQGDILIYILK